MRFRELSHAKTKKIAGGLVVVAVVSLVGIALLRGSHAATPFVATETEAGTATGTASVITDTTASAGKALKFGAASTKVDASTIVGKYMLGYQGWFQCPTEGSPQPNWNHWFVNGDKTKPIVDQWPDTSELATADKCDTGLKLPNGTPAYVYSDYNPRVEDLHMKWLQDYGVDGVMLQRFGGMLPLKDTTDFNNRVPTNVMASAEKYGRTFDIMYDITGMTDGAATRTGCSSKLVCAIEDDWKSNLIDALKLTSSTAYQKQAGKPLVVIWGFGFGDRPGTPAEAIELNNWFHNNPYGAQYDATVMGGIPGDWTTNSYAAAYKTYDIVSRWSVADGKLTSASDTTTFDTWGKEKTYADAVYAKQNGLLYMPVVWPGISAYNRDTNEGGVVNANFNVWPRYGGNQIWQEAYNNIKQLKAAGLPVMLYGAMYDEANEGTSRIKYTTSAATSPAGLKLMYSNMDGYTQLPSDWYLQVDREIAKMLRGETALSQTMPTGITPH